MSQPSNNSRVVLTLSVFVLVLVIGIWTGAWLVGSQKAFFADLSTQPLSDVFSSINALFAGLAFGGLIITIYMQLREIHETKQQVDATARATADMANSNLELARLSDERSVMDLFQIYCSEYFQTVKNSSMSVLIPAVASKPYADYVVSRLCVAQQLPFPEDCWERVSKSTYSKSLEDFKDADQHNRYKLDELINFFTMLAGRRNAKDAVRRCDFSYSWWRPLLWMLAIQQRARYEQYEEIRRFSTPLYLIEAVTALDRFYGLTPFETDEDVWRFFVSHPKIKSYRMDPQYSVLANLSSS